MISWWLSEVRGQFSYWVTRVYSLQIQGVPKCRNMVSLFPFDPERSTKDLKWNKSERRKILVVTWSKTWMADKNISKINSLSTSTDSTTLSAIHPWSSNNRMAVATRKGESWRWRKIHKPDAELLKRANYPLLMGRSFFSLALTTGWFFDWWLMTAMHINLVV